MLFNSYIFIFLYLPVVTIGYFFLCRKYIQFRLIWLFICSLIFYVYWNLSDIYVLVFSILLNTIFIAILRYTTSKCLARVTLIVAIASNLSLLLYYKYVNFIINSINSVFFFTESSIQPLPSLVVALPLGISFFTFTQIVVVVDTFYNRTQKYDFLTYSLFVTYFPHLLAGPLVHHKDLISQLKDTRLARWSWGNVAEGLTIFIIGLAKKLVLADQFGQYANIVFENNYQDSPARFYLAWMGALSYTFQIYFDFSGYTDMALGISKMFGINLPQNFNSPYKSKNLIEFWHRWHITLSQFLRDYLYIPLGGNRSGKLFQYRNIFITMCLGGLWHGANWTFVIWGLFHGIALVFTHEVLSWRVIKSIQRLKCRRLVNLLAVLITFVFVVVTWVIFRADTLTIALNILEHMFVVTSKSINESSLDARYSIFVEYKNYLYNYNFGWQKNILFVAVGFVIVWAMPNTNEFISGKKMIKWSPSFLTFCSFIMVFHYCLYKISDSSQFIYFQF